MTEERKENNMTSEETQKIEELLAIFDIAPDQITIEETKREWRGESGNREGWWGGWGLRGVDGRW